MRTTAINRACDGSSTYWCSALGEHLAIETTALAGLPRNSGSLPSRDGQGQILSTLTALVRSVKDINYGDCESLAGELDELLRASGHSGAECLSETRFP